MVRMKKRALKPPGAAVDGAPFRMMRSVGNRRRNHEYVGSIRRILI